MKVIIKSSGLISPQQTHDTSSFPAALSQTVSNRMVCIEPEYKNLINAILLRRMPRILKMGLASAQLCINRAGGINPDGIIVGTGLGCLDNLEKFMMEIIDNNEQIKSVLPFINSTHNAVAAQIAMLLKNHNYNVTYCHRGFSFESALKDGLMLIHEDKAKHVLVGGIDECTHDFVLLHSYLNDWKAPVDNLKLLETPTTGTIAGEGSGFFMLAGESATTEPEIRLEGIHTFFTPHKPEIGEIWEEITTFLREMDFHSTDLDGVMLGLNGDARFDPLYYDVMSKFDHQHILYFKHLCGEYYTSTAFALWLASVILNMQNIPSYVTLRKGKSDNFRSLLLYNQLQNSEHSLILMRYGSF